MPGQEFEPHPLFFCLWHAFDTAGNVEGLARGDCHINRVETSGGRVEACWHCH